MNYMTKDWESAVKAFDRLLDDVLCGVTNDVRVYPTNYPLLDVFINEEDKTLIMEWALAGIPKDKIEVSVEGNALTLSIDKVDRSKAGFARIQHRIKTSQQKNRYAIPSTKYELDKIEVSFTDGILSAKIPAKENQRKKTVNIK